MRAPDDFQSDRYESNMIETRRIAIIPKTPEIECELIGSHFLQKVWRQDQY